MLLKCDRIINERQVGTLQKYKKNPESFDAMKKGYAELVEIDVKQFNDDGLVGDKKEKIGRVVYSNEEQAMLRKVEDINSGMNRDSEKNRKANKEGIKIGGFDTASLSKG